MKTFENPNTVKIKQSKDKTKFDSFYSSSKAEIIINESDINNAFKSIYTKIITNIQVFQKVSGWIIDSVIDYTISISKYNPLGGSSYIKLPKELDHLRKGLIIKILMIIRWCLVGYLNFANHHPATITKADKDFVKRPNFKDKIFSKN